MGLDTSFNCWVYELQYLERRAGGYKIETKREVPDINWEGVIFGILIPKTCLWY